MRANNLANDRIGKVNKNNQGSLMEVIQYKNSNDILVRFNEGFTVRTEWKKFLLGQVRNVYDKTVYGVGYLGEGSYKSRDISGKRTPQYNLWSSILMRCYSKKHQERNPAYRCCTVSEEWHNFQNFAKWYDENYFEVDEVKMHIDKDILIKGNKVYSPETCVFVPHSINTLIVKNDRLRGDLPLGVSFNKREQRYEVHCHNNKGECVYLGKYNNAEDGFQIYKKYKEELIKQLASKYKDKVPNKLYEAMINYVVEITD